MSVTPVQFKTAKPQFADVPDETVQTYLDMAALMAVDASWPAAYRDPATIAFTCHLMTLDGLGTDGDSALQSSGLAAYQSIKSGELSLTRYQKTAETTDFSSWLGETSCGKFYAIMLQQVKRGPVLLYGGIGHCVSPYAKDWPPGSPQYGWPGVIWGA